MTASTIELSEQEAFSIRSVEGATIGDDYSPLTGFETNMPDGSGISILHSEVENVCIFAAGEIFGNGRMTETQIQLTLEQGRELLEAALASFPPRKESLQ